DLTCAAGCKVDADCLIADAGVGVKMACCDHLCVDENSDVAHCGSCGKTCAQPESCCSGLCSDPAKDVSNCGMCGRVCAGKNASWACQSTACAVTGCVLGFADCNGSAADGCEVATTTDSMNCGKC